MRCRVEFRKSCNPINPPQMVCHVSDVLTNRCPANESVVLEPSAADKQFYGPGLPSSSAWRYEVLEHCMCCCEISRVDYRTANQGNNRANISMHDLAFVWICFGNISESLKN